MTDSSSLISKDSVQTAYEDGRRMGLATGALAASVVAWFNLLGVEKSAFAIVLALLALQGAAGAKQVLRRGRLALLIASLHLVTVVAVFVIFRDQWAELFHLLQKLG